MLRVALIVITSFLFTTAFAQTGTDALKDSVETEGRKLYRSEMASWYGTDILLETLKDRRQDVGGYFSYAIGDDSARCIFFDKGATPLVLAAVTFNSYDKQAGDVDAIPRKLTDYENSLYAIRKAALAQINGDTLFKTYKNTNLNLVPLVDGASRKVYVLTGPEENGVVIFGNDYLLTFDNANSLIAERRLHKNIIISQYGNSEQEQFGGIHTHLPETGDLITPTDICTLMLYEKFAKWQQYIVVSENYVSIWDCTKNTLLTLTKNAWDKIYSNKKRH